LPMSSTRAIMSKVGSYSLKQVNRDLVFQVLGRSKPTSPCRASSAGSLLQPGVWAHVAAWYDGLHAVVAINGQVQSSTACPNGPVYYPTTPGAFYVGADAGGRESYAGLIDEVRVRQTAPLGNFGWWVPNQRATYRWAVWSSYAQSHGWFSGNNSSMFGGVAPSVWGDGRGTAGSMSSSKEVLRTLFSKKGYAVANSNVWSEEWYAYSSTNSKHAGALFRVRNLTNKTITWKLSRYYSSYGGWGEYASTALNGKNIWSTSSNQSYGTVTHSLQIPPNRVSTVIVISGSSSQSGTRTCYLGFYNNSLKLPAGLVYVDDLDTAPDGWNN